MTELVERVNCLGADAILGIKLDTGTINTGQANTLMLITATGTAVQLR